MIIRDNVDGMDYSSFAEMEKQSAIRRQEPANPQEFLNSVTVILRESKEKLNNYEQRQHALQVKADQATMSMKRIESFITINNRKEITRMQDMHRQFMHEYRTVPQLVNKLRAGIQEANTNKQFVLESLNNVLADRHKKVAVQKELGLRLRDLEKDIERAESVIVKVEKLENQLNTALQNLLNKIKFKLPPEVREKLSMDERVDNIAAMYGKNLKSIKDVKKENGRVRNLSGLDQAPSEAVVEEPSDPQEASASKIGALPALALIGTGAVVSYLVISSYVG